MIRSITLKNFQLHESRTFDLRPGLNVFTGASDKGKSAVVRALLWLCLHGNQNYTKHGKTECSVTVDTVDGTVSRFRGKRNGYTVNGEDYVAVGTNQPVTVKQVIPLSDINCQQQHDSPFLLSLTPGQTAKEINKIVDLSVIDSCVAWCKKTLAKETTILRSVETEISGLTAKQESLAWVPAAQEAWATITKLRDAATRTMERITKIEDISRNIREINTAGRNANAVAKALQDFLGKVPEIRDDRELATVILLYKESSTKIEELDSLVTAFSVFPDMLQKIRDGEIRYMDITNAVSEILESRKNLEKAESDIKKLEEALGYCPTCGNQFGK